MITDLRFLAESSAHAARVISAVGFRADKDDVAVESPGLPDSNSYRRPNKAALAFCIYKQSRLAALTAGIAKKLDSQVGSSMNSFQRTNTAHWRTNEI